MKKLNKEIFSKIATLLLVTGLSNGYAQNEFYNNGSAITVQAGALVSVQGEVVNTNAGANIGLIANSGLISFSGNWTNNSNSGALMPTTGSVEMVGPNQSINGTQPTRFNNLNLLGSGIKTLNVNTFVSGATGVLALGTRPLDLNSQTLFVTNPISAAITRSTGYIISETSALSGYGIIQWSIGNSAAGNYTFPFGSFSANYIPLNLTITTPGVQSTSGAISASTYPTNTNPALNNRPLPTGVADLNNNCNTEHAPKMLDRFWVINTNNYNTNPAVNKQFTYIDNEWDLTGGSTNIITETDLQAWYYNASWTHLTSTNNPAANNQIINANSNYGVFTLGDYKELHLQLVDVDSVICFGESNGIITFSANAGYGSPTYSLNGTATTNTLINTLAAGTYTVMASDIMGCTDAINSIKVDEPLKLVAAITSDTYTICRNEKINLEATFSGGIKPYNVAWSNGITNTSVITNTISQTVMPQTTVKYWFDISDKNNCTTPSNTITVIVNQLPVLDFTADNVEGCQPLTVNFTNLSSAAPIVATWLWSFGNGATSTEVSPNYIYDIPGTFTVKLKATSVDGCTNELPKQNYILVHPKPKANFNYTPVFGIDILNPEVSFTNTSTGYDNVLWSFNDGTPQISDINPTHIYADTGVYQVKLIVTTQFDCVDMITIPLKVNEISTLYVPNAFTPDGNSLNDVFAPSGIEVYDYKMMIFDRWGEKIFESTVPNEGWDGKYRGTLCKEGVYVYKIEFKPNNGPVKHRDQTMVGHVTLLRNSR